MDWLLIFGMVFIIEGLIPLLFPKQWQSYVRKLANEPIREVRIVGAVLFIIGAVLLLIK